MFLGLSIELLQEHAQRVLAQSASVHNITYVLAFAGWLGLRSVPEIKGLALIYAAFLAFGGLVGVYVFNLFGLVIAPDALANIVVTSLIGMTLTLFALLLVQAVVRAMTPKAKAVDYGYTGVGSTGQAQFNGRSFQRDA